MAPGHPNTDQGLAYEYIRLSSPDGWALVHVTRLGRRLRSRRRVCLGVVFEPAELILVDGTEDPGGE